MVRRAVELGALAVSRMAEAGMHAVDGVLGIYMQIASGRTKSWILRLTVGSKRRGMGLGAHPEVTLAGARDKARAARLKIEGGRDPIVERQRLVSALRAEQAGAMTFDTAAQQFVDDFGDE